MYRIEGTIEGIAPLLFNGWTAESIEALDNGKTGGKRDLACKVSEGEAKAYRNDKGVFIPAGNFKKCILEGAGMAQLKDGKRSVVPYLRAEIFFSERELSLGRETHDGLHVSVGKRPPGPKGAAVVIRRPMLNTGWQLCFTLVVVMDRRTPEQIKEAVETAGKYVGLGDWRPEYGRFSLIEWEVVK